MTTEYDHTPAGNYFREATPYDHNTGTWYLWENC